MAKFCHSGKNLRILTGKRVTDLQNFEPTLVKLLCFWATFYSCKWPNIENNVAVWSHWLEATTITTRFLVSLWSIVFDGGYEQCDLIGRFLKVFGVKFYYKSSAFWGFFAKHHFKVKTSVATLG